MAKTISPAATRTTTIGAMAAGTIADLDLLRGVVRVQEQGQDDQNANQQQTRMKQTHGHERALLP